MPWRRTEGTEWIRIDAGRPEGRSNSNFIINICLNSEINVVINKVFLSFIKSFRGFCCVRTYNLSEFSSKMLFCILMRQLWNVSWRLFCCSSYVEMPTLVWLKMRSMWQECAWKTNSSTQSINHVTQRREQRERAVGDTADAAVDVTELQWSAPSCWISKSFKSSQYLLPTKTIHPIYIHIDE